MKKIRIFEEAIGNKTHDLGEAGINRTMFWAYRDSLEAENDLLDFNDVIWDKDVEDIAGTCRENGIEEFTISSTFSSLIQTLAAFEEHGIRMAGLTTTRSRYTDWQTGEHQILPAILMCVVSNTHNYPLRGNDANRADIYHKWLQWSELSEYEKQQATDSYVHMRAEEEERSEDEIDSSGVKSCRFERMTDGYIHVDL